MKVINTLYGYIAAAFIFIVLVDTLLGIHPLGNIVAAALLLVACYQIGRTQTKRKNKGQ